MRRTGNAEFAGVDNAGVDNSAPCGRDGICRSGQISTMRQGWTLQEWIMRHHVAGVDNAGVDKSARCGKGGHCRSGQCGTIVAGMDNAAGPKIVCFPTQNVQ